MNNSISAGDFATAANLLSYDVDTLANTGIDTATGVVMADDTGADNVVTNYRLYYRLLITYAQDTLSVTDSARLVTLAHKCPIVDGAIIYAARALYSAVFNDMRVFGEGDCDEISIASGKGIHNADEDEVQS